MHRNPQDPMEMDNAALPEESAEEKFIRLLEDALATARGLPPHTLVAALVPHFVRQQAPPTAAPCAPLPPLTRRQQQVLTLTLHPKDYTLAQIAEKLGLKKSSIREHRRALADRLKAKSRTRAAIIRAAAAAGWV